LTIRVWLGPTWINLSVDVVLPHRTGDGPRHVVFVETNSKTTTTTKHS